VTLNLLREQILGHRRRASCLEERLPYAADSLRRAAWAGLQDSMPRAAVLSIHARLSGTRPDSWEDPALVQIWGPRYSAYAVPAEDRHVFTVSRMPDEARGLAVAEDMAARMAGFLVGRRMKFDDVDRGMGNVGNRMRYAAPTGTILMRWAGALQPDLWTVPRPDVPPLDARMEMARRHLHIFGPATPPSFAEWAGIGPRQAQAAYDALDAARELTAVTTPIGERWILTNDEASFRAVPQPNDVVRLLPSGDTYYLLQGRDRELLLPDASQRAELWTSRVWPGALLIGDEIVGTWRRSNAVVSVQTWRKLSAPERQSVESEVSAMPLPGIAAQLRVPAEHPN
jgi:hypothetical protein